MVSGTHLSSVETVARVDQVVGGQLAPVYFLAGEEQNAVASPRQNAK